MRGVGCVAVCKRNSWVDVATCEEDKVVKKARGQARENYCEEKLI